MAPCVESAELLLLADEQLCSPLRRPPCRMPQGSGSTRFKLVKVALEATLQAMAGHLGVTSAGARSRLDYVCSVTWAGRLVRSTGVV